MHVQNKNIIKQRIYKPRITAKQKDCSTTASGPEKCRSCKRDANKNKWPL